MTINPESFEQAFKAARSYPGMGSLEIQFNPYTWLWIARITFADNSLYECIGEIDEALEGVAKKVHENPPAKP